MAGKERIKDFVQNILGCTCPDKVFEQIQEFRSAPISSPHSRSIIIGGRLLIYIWNVEDTGSLRENLLAMLAAGRQERDARGLNRFRAVLAVDKALQQVAAAAHAYFSQFEGRDDRMHLHVVSVADLEEV